MPTYKTSKAFPFFLLFKLNLRLHHNFFPPNANHNFFSSNTNAIMRSFFARSFFARLALCVTLFAAFCMATSTMAAPYANVTYANSSSIPQINARDTVKLPSFALQSANYKANIHNLSDPLVSQFGPVIINIDLPKNGGQRPPTGVSPGEEYYGWGTLQSDYFTKNIPTSLEAQSAEFFREFLDDYAENDAFGCREGPSPLGAVQCFLRAYTGELNWGCRIDAAHACRIPSAIEVVDHVFRNWDTDAEFTNDVKAEIARKAYFTVLNLKESMLYLETIMGIHDHVSITMTQQAGGLVQQFTPQPEFWRAYGCKVANMALDIAEDVLYKKFMGWITGFGPAAMPNLPPFESFLGENPDKTVEEIRKLWLESGARIQELQKLFQQSKKFKLYEKWELAMKWYGRIKEGYQYVDEIFGPWIPKPRPNPGADRGEGKLTTTFSAARGVCGNVFGLMGEDQQMNTGELIAYIVNDNAELRSSFADLFEYMIGYDPEEPDNLILRYFMEEEYLSTAATKLNSGYNQDYSAVTQAVTAGLVSELHAGSRCSMECNIRDDAQDLCDKAANKIIKDDIGKTKKVEDVKWLRDARYCPDSKTVCQASCYPKYGLMGMWRDKMKIHGKDSFGMYGLSMDNLLQNSWDQYAKTHGMNFTRVYDEMNVRQEPINLHKLPVCLSNHHTVQSPRLFDWGCGGFSANETASYLQDVSINLAGEREAAHAEFPKLLRQIDSPYESYMMTCNANVRWPQHNSYRWWTDLGEMQNGKRDARCDIVKQETMFMNEFEANHHFCNSESAKFIFADESSHLNRPTPSPLNSKDKCKNWTKKNLAKIETEGAHTQEKYEQALAKIEQDEKDYREQRKQERIEKKRKQKEKKERQREKEERKKGGE